MGMDNPVSKLNVLGEPLQPCCSVIKTGYFRDGYCRTDQSDYGRHVVCAIVTEEFLTFTQRRGNDLSTPMPAYGFPGLKPGDKWCLCASRWKEAHEQGCAPPVILKACEKSALNIVPLELLQQYQLS